MRIRAAIICYCVRKQVRFGEEGEIGEEGEVREREELFDEKRIQY